MSLIRRFLRWIGWLKPFPYKDIDEIIWDIEPLDTPFMRKIRRDKFPNKLG